MAKNEPIDATLKCPFNMIVSGPSQSGKTEWVARLLNYSKELMEKNPRVIHWHSPHDHLPDLDSTLIVKSFKHLPWEEDGDNDDDDDEIKADLIVIDDFAQETSNSKALTAFLTKFSHHRGTSLILLSQNLFWSGKETRTQSLNMHYIVLMRQTRDHRQIRTLARQMTQSNEEYNLFLQAYNQATDERHFAYLLISSHPRDDKHLLLRSNIFPEDAKTTTIYLLNKKYK